MTTEEMKKIIEITATADNGCGPCVSTLWKELFEEFKFPKELFLEFKDSKRYWIKDIPEWVEEWK